MEHGAVTDLTEATCENLIETYLSLGRATTGTREIRDSGFVAVRGTIPHPLCNFAGRLRLDPNAAARLATLAEQSKTFHVYSTPADKPRYAAELLVAAGFTPQHAMEQMVYVPSGDIEQEDPPLALCEDEGYRAEVAEFMVSQFFSNHSPQFRALVTQATAGALDLNLWALRRGGKILAACMLSPHGGVCGLYNLCVAAPHRSMGLGTYVTKWVQRYAAATRRPVTLQCEPSLQTWYAGMGFRSLDGVTVFSLSRRGH